MNRPLIVSSLLSLRRIFAGVLLLGAAACSAFADVVTDWNTAVENSLLVPAQRGPRVPGRTLAIMHVAMFDAVNAIEKKYQPWLITADAPPGARADAAAIQAAHTVLSALLPVHQAAYDAQLQTSLAGLPGQEGNSESIARGRAWGESVATAIIAARANDGSTAILPPFVGSTAAGYWRHAPLGASPTAGYANLVTVPFVVTNPMAFDPGPPYGFADRSAALASAAYAADVNEVKARGGAVSTERTAEDLDLALFIDACDVAGLNRVFRSMQRPNAKLIETARAFALFNMAGFDAGVVFFRLKYHHALWRPFQAINFADESNPAIVADPTWTSRLGTPPHPEYISAHVTLFATLLRVASRLAGDSGAVDLVAAASAAYPGGTKSFESLAAISDATVNARVDVGYHFRETGEISQIVGREIADAIVDGALQPRGDRY
jgi:hypothetical protein